MALYAKGIAPIGLRTQRFILEGETYVVVREMSSSTLLAYQAKFQEGQTTEYDLAMQMILDSVVDDDGKPLFESIDDVKANFNVGLSKIYGIKDLVFKLSRTPEGEDPKN